MEWIPDHLRVYAAVGGMLLTLLIVAALINKYEQYQATRRLAAQRIMSAARSIDLALQNSQQIGLPPGIGKLLREELLARYITVHQVYPRYPGISQMAAQAEERLRLEPDGAASPNVTGINSVEILNRYISGLTEIIRLLSGKVLGAGLNREERAAYQVKVLEFQVAAADSYYKRTALKLAESGEWYKAQRNMRALESFLISRPGMSREVNRLRAETREMLLAFMEQRLPGDPSGVSSDQAAS